MKMHKERLTNSLSSYDLVLLADEFREFKKHIVSSQYALRGALPNHACTVKGKDRFSKAWMPFWKTIKFVMFFCGGLAAVFSDTTTVRFHF